MHDRRIDGNTHTFGNAGGLFMSAMTWYDHETRSVWSQPLGRAIQGELKGVELFLLPFQLTTWSTWKQSHPETLVMVNDTDRLGPRRQEFNEDFVVGLVLDQQAKAYYFTDILSAGVINDNLGNIPVMIWASGDEYHAYVRQVDGQVLTFDLDGQVLIDNETGSHWKIQRGLSVEGPLAGQALQPVPSLSSFDWAWDSFYPKSEIYQP